MRHRRPTWLVLYLIAALLSPAQAQVRAVGIPGGEKPADMLMNEAPILPPDARKKFDLTAQDPTAVAELGVVDFFQLVADILHMNIVMADKTKIESRRVGIVMRDMTIEEAVRLVLQMNDLKAVHFNENTIIVMDRASKSDFGFKQPQRFRLRYTTIDKVRDYINLNKNIQRQLGDSISFDVPNNTIIAIDTPENLGLLERVISQIDIPPMKVLEAVKLSYLDNAQFVALARTLGTDITTRLGAMGLSYNKDARALMVYGTPEDVRLIRGLVDKLDVAPKQVLIDTSFLQVSDSFNKEFGFKFTTNSFTVNQFDRIKDIDRIRSSLNETNTFPTRTQINYLISKTGAKTIQSPKVRAIDGTAANIQIGEIRNIQIQSTATTLGTGLTPGQQQTTFNTQEVPIGVQVTVTPTIHNDESVTLDMNIAVTKVLEIKSFGVDRTTQNSATKLRMRNGETVVLGGFINSTLNTDDTPIPFLGEVPLLDKIFRNKKRERTDSELVFLLTPYILDFQDKAPRSDICETPLGEIPKLVLKSKEATTITTSKLGETGPTKEDLRAANKGAKAQKIEVKTTRVLESQTGSTEMVYDSKGKLLSKQFIPKRSGGAVESVAPRVISPASSAQPSETAPVKRASALDAVVRQHQAAISRQDTDGLRRIAALAQAAPAPTPNVHSRVSDATMGIAGAPGPIERLAKLAGKPVTTRRVRPVAPVPHPELERLRAERARAQAPKEAAADQADEADDSHPMLAELRAERLKDQQKHEAEEMKAVVAGAKAAQDEVHARLETQEDELDPKPAANPTSGKQAKSARPGVHPGTSAQHDRDLIDRLRSLTSKGEAAGGGAGGAQAKTAAMPSAPGEAAVKPSVAEQAGFDDLATSLERDIGRM